MGTLIKLVSAVLPVLALPLVLSGCIVQSVQPFYAASSIVQVPGIEGEWAMLDAKGKARDQNAWNFGRDRVITYDDQGARGELKVTYFRVGDGYFADATADEPSAGTSSWWVMHVVPVHTVSRVVLTDDSLVIVPLSFAWMKRAIREQRVSLPSIRWDAADDLVFTATSEEWLAFLEKFGSNTDVFPEDGALRFVRKKSASDTGRKE